MSLRRWLQLAMAAGLLVLVSAAGVYGQRLTNTSNGTLTAVVIFNVTPGTGNTPISNQVQFRIRNRQAAGYRVEASATYSTAPSASVDGGVTIAPSDIGVGITSVDISRPGVLKPRVDTIAPGFNYNPSTVAGSNGLTPYTGMAAGEATLADVVSNPNLGILSGPRIAANQNVNGPNNYITVRLTLALLPQYFTPGTFTAVITLTIRNGQ